MTCIVGIAEGGSVHIAGDSAGMDSRYARVARVDRKVFRNGDFIMGFTTSFRMGQLLAHSLQPPQRHPSRDVYSFMVTDFVNAVRDCLKSGGYAEKSNEVETGGVFLVGYEGRLFKIGGDYQVGESLHGYDACGCGDLIALGSLHETCGQTPEHRLNRALEAAAQFSGGVCAPFHTVSTAASTA